MFHILIYLHVLSALLVGSIILFPFLIKRLQRASASELLSLVTTLLFIVRVIEWALVALLLTGGALISLVSTLSGLWMALTFILFVIVGAFMGIVQRKLRKFKKSNQAQPEILMRHLSLYSWIIVIAIILILVVMTNPELF